MQYFTGDWFGELQFCDPVAPDTHRICAFLTFFSQIPEVSGLCRQPYGCGQPEGQFIEQLKQVSVPPAPVSCSIAAQEGDAAGSSNANEATASIAAARKNSELVAVLRMSCDLQKGSCEGANRVM